MPRISSGLRAERRQNIMDAAWRCAARVGYHDMTVDDVCAEAGVSKGAFYGYFTSKRNLLTALLRDDATRVDELLKKLEASDLSSVERLRRFTRGALDDPDGGSRTQVRADLWTVMLTDEELRSELAAVVRRRRAVLRSWVHDGVTSGEFVEVPSNALASILLALSDGLMLYGALDPSGFRWENVRRAVAVLLDGIAADQQQPERGGC